MIQAEAACAEFEERVKDVKEEEETWRNEELKHMDINVDLRGEIEVLKEKCEKAQQEVAKHENLCWESRGQQGTDVHDSVPYSFQRERKFV